MIEPIRCAWAGDDPLMIAYHDTAWGIPQHDDRVLFEFLILEGAQAGLSWQTILKKRENYRRAFDRFNPKKIALYDAKRKAALLRDPGIVRNRAKIDAAIGNARAFLEVQREFRSFDRYAWKFVGGRQKRNRVRSARAVPAQTEESRGLSDDLRRRGFNFVGPTICYAFMQAVGMVDDHLDSCIRKGKR